MSTPLIIEAAINGATSKSQNPNVPRQVDEIVECACACIEAGATIIHHHTDDSILQGRHDATAYRAAWTRIRAKHPDAILYPTMGGGGAHTNPRERYSHIEELADDGLLQLAIIDPGSVSLGPRGDDGLPMAIDFVYQNTFADVRYMADACCSRGLGAHISIFEPGFLRVALDYHRAGRFPRALKIQLYFGGPALPFGLPPTEKSLDAYLAMLEGTGLPWMVGVLGGDVRESLAEPAIRRGGHVRVGLEDYAGAGTPRNEALVADITVLASQRGRRLATPEEARAIIGVRRTASV
jgi:uncharacterized protein (DUF849 family)